MKYIIPSRKLCHQSPNLIMLSVNKKFATRVIMGNVCVKIKANFHSQLTTEMNSGARNDQNTKVIEYYQLNAIYVQIWAARNVETFSGLFEDK